MKLYYCITVVDRCISVQPVESTISKGQPLTGTIYPKRVLPLLKKLSNGKQKMHRRILTFLTVYEGQRGCRLNGRAAADLLDKLLATGHTYWLDNRRHPLRSCEPVPSRPVWELIEQEDRLKPTYAIENNCILLPCSPPAVLDPQTLCVHRLNIDLPAEACSDWQSAKPMQQADCIPFIERLHERHRRAAFPPPPQIVVVETNDIAPAPILRLHKAKNQDATETAHAVELIAGFNLDYAGMVIPCTDEREHIRFIRDGSLMDIQRNRQEERRYLEQLGALGFIPYEDRSGDLFKQHEYRNFFVPDPQGRHNWHDLLNRVFPELRQQGWQIETINIDLVSVSENDWYSSISPNARHWFAFETGIRVDGRNINLLPHIHAYLRERRRWDLTRFQQELAGSSIPLDIGKQILLIPGDRFLLIIQYLFELYADNPFSAGDKLRLNMFRAAEIRDALQITQKFEDHPEIEALGNALKKGLSIKALKEPRGIEAQLRPYQRTGLGWLDFLRTHRMCGILADDMGLGKTLQALALLQREKNAKRLDHPALLVVPTSVLPNWRNEIHRFAPGLTYHYHHGKDRHQAAAEQPDYDLLLTTYALVRRDADWLQAQPFSWIILDEAQAMKNPRSKTAICLCKIDSRHRLCLTGTPMENHLGELWSLFHFLQPGFLGGYDTFRRHFQKPIENGTSPMLQRMLKRRIRPFLLRRTKSEVERDLPEKVDILESLALTEKQRDLYETVRMAMSRRIRDEMEAKGFERSRFMILQALLKLRQICCDPRLDKAAVKTTEKDSSKLTWLRGRLPGMIEDGRRILLFSQFTSMIALIEKMLHGLHIPYELLTGSTKDRETPVRRFQDGEVPVFLLSLKAGGTGLNLTAADTVIHYDPWWNPATEQQATDRAHRIGQDKSVFIYKLIAATSIEERILEMQKRKARLTESMLDTSETRGKGLTFSEEDLAYLLAPLPGEDSV